MVVEVRCRADEPQRVRWAFLIWNAEGEIALGGSLMDQRDHHIDLPAGGGSLRAVIDPLPLGRGRYCLKGAVFDSTTNVPLATFGIERRPQTFEVVGDPYPERPREVGRHPLVSVGVAFEPAAEGEAQAPPGG